MTHFAIDITNMFVLVGNVAYVVVFADGDAVVVAAAAGVAASIVAVADADETDTGNDDFAKKDN